MVKPWLAIGCAFSIISHAAPAQPKRYVELSSITTYDLVKSCRETGERGMEATFCTGYITAAFDQLALAGSVCLSGDSLTAQVVAVARKRLLETPEDWHRPPGWVIADALKRAFPC